MKDKFRPGCLDPSLRIYSKLKYAYYQDLLIRDLRGKFYLVVPGWPRNLHPVALRPHSAGRAPPIGRHHDADDGFVALARAETDEGYEVCAQVDECL